MSRPGNSRTLYLAIQEDKDTPAEEPTVQLRLRSLDKNPVRSIIALDETDASTQEGGSVVSGYAPGGSFGVYLRPSEADLIFLLLLGASVDTGTTGQYVHTITPTVNTPYFTLWEVEPDGEICNMFTGARLTEATVQGGQGQPLELTGIAFEALGFAAGATPPETPDVIDEGPYIYPEVTNTIGGEANGDVDQFSMTISRNGQRLGGDGGFNSFDYANGKLSVAYNVTKYYTNEDVLRRTDTGSTGGTVPTPTIAVETLSIKALRTAHLSIEFVSTKTSVATAVAGINTDGTPLTVVIAGRTEPTATLADNLTVIVKNAIATADHAA